MGGLLEDSTICCHVGTYRLLWAIRSAYGVPAGVVEVTAGDTFALVNVLPTVSMNLKVSGDSPGVATLAFMNRWNCA